MALKELYRKVDAFQDNLSSESKAFSQCRKGCSRCCMVDLSVFRVEADNIREWYTSLSSSEKKSLKEKWENDTPSGQCSFLCEDSCTIYEARPLICRSQGLPLRFQEGGETYVDICPLNEDMMEVVKGVEILNLDLLNTILSKIEAMEGGERLRVDLTDLKKEFLKSED